MALYGILAGDYISATLVVNSTVITVSFALSVVLGQLMLINCPTIVIVKRLQDVSKLSRFTSPPAMAFVGPAIVSAEPAGVFLLGLRSRQIFVYGGTEVLIRPIIVQIQISDFVATQRGTNWAKGASVDRLMVEL